MNPHYMVLAECDKVMMVMQRYIPDPQKPGKYYETFGFEVYRIKDGKLYEHWDAAMIPNPVPEHLKTPVKDLKAK
jgi:predicted SnoaL-like aldol condensation-catalyzing enzyme